MFCIYISTMRNTLPILFLRVQKRSPVPSRSPRSSLHFLSYISFIIVNLRSKPKRKTTQRVVFLLVIRVHFRYFFSILKLFCRPWAARESGDSFNHCVAGSLPGECQSPGLAYFIFESPLKSKPPAKPGA